MISWWTSRRSWRGRARRRSRWSLGVRVGRELALGGRGRRRALRLRLRWALRLWLRWALRLRLLRAPGPRPDGRPWHRGRRRALVAVVVRACLLAWLTAPLRLALFPTRPVLRGGLRLRSRLRLPSRRELRGELWLRPAGPDRLGRQARLTRSRLLLRAGVFTASRADGDQHGGGGERSQAGHVAPAHAFNETACRGCLASRHAR